MTHIIYRKLPDVPHRQYVRRIIDRRFTLWHRDPAVALRMERDEAERWADRLRKRPTGYGGTRGVTAPAGEYGIQEVTPGDN